MACTGSETGNAQLERPERPVSIALAFATSPSGGLAASSADGLVIAAEQGTAWVESIELGLSPGEVCSDDPVAAESLGAFFHERCSNGNTLLLEGPWMVDLITGRFDPPLEGLTLPESALDEVRVKLRGERQGRSPAIEVLGLIGDREFEFALIGTIPSKFVAETPVLISDDLGRLVLDLGFARWFEGLEMEPCLDAQAGAEAPIDFSGRGCGGIEQQVRNQLVRGDLRSEPR